MAGSLGKARYVVALLSALLIFQAGVVTPASVVAEEPVASPTAGPASPPPSKPAPSTSPPADGSPALVEPETAGADGPGVIAFAPNLGFDTPPGVEIASMRTANSRTYAQQDGSFVTELFSSAVHYQAAGSAEWQPVDPRFTTDPTDSSRLRSDKAPARVVLARPTPNEFLSVEAHGRRIAFALTNPPAAPAGINPPVLRNGGLFAEYVDFLPGGIDLRVFPRADGAKSFLVLDGVPANPTFTFAVTAPGLSLTKEADRSVVLRDASGQTVASIPAPYVLDSSGEPDHGYSEAVSLDVGGTTGAPTVAISVDPVYLATAAYPVFVDPSIIFFGRDTENAADTFISSANPSTNHNGFTEGDGTASLRVGYNSNKTANIRTLVRFPGIAETLGEAHIDNASLRLRAYWQNSGSTSTPTNIRRVTSPWDVNTVTWNTAPTFVADISPSSANSAQGEDVIFGVTANIQAVVDKNLTHDGYLLHGTTGDATTFKKFYASETGYAARPRLRVAWHRPIATPSDPTAGETTTTRTFAWTYDDNDTAATRAQSHFRVQVSTSSSFSTIIANGDSGIVTGSGTSWTLPTSASLTGGTTYHWRVKVKDGVGWSEWAPASFVAQAGTVTAAISAPASNEHRRGGISITGTAAGSDFEYYNLKWATGCSLSDPGYQTDSQATSILPDPPSYTQVTNGGLGYWNTGTRNGKHRIILTVERLSANLPKLATACITVDNTAPTASLATPSLSGVAPILGVATDNLGFKEYVVEWAPGADATSGWSLVDPASPVFVNAVVEADPATPLAIWDTTGKQGVYTVRLTVRDLAGNEVIVTANVDVAMSNLGLQTHNSFESFDLGNGDVLSVNVATGNVVVSSTLVELPTRGGGLSLALVYNSLDRTDVGMGPGWRLSVMSRLTELANGDVVYASGDGARHIFTKIATNGSITTYTRPDTLYATLKKDSSATAEWTLVWRNGSVDAFDALGAAGLLSRSADRYGNGIDYAYFAGTDRLYRATDATGRYVQFAWDTGASPPRLSSFTDWAYVSDGVVQTTSTGSRRLYRFFYGADGQLIGWSNPKNTTGACPTNSQHRACLAYASGKLTSITKRQVPAAIVNNTIGTGAIRDVTTTLLYEGGRVTEVRDPEQTAGSSAGTTFEWVGAGRLRVIRQGTPPSVTTYVQVGGADSLGRIASVLRRLDTADIEQLTVWDASYPIQPASVTDNAGGTPARTVSYTYVANSIGLVATVTEPLTTTATRTTTYTYNTNNDLTEEAVSSGSASATTRFCYGASGCSLSATGLTMRARIDNYKDGTKGGANGNEQDVTTEYLYDQFGQTVRETRFNYDSTGTLLDQRSIAYQYDSVGNLTKQIVNFADGVVSSSGSDVTPDASTNARTDLTTVHGYDTAGNRLSTADPRRAIGLAVCSAQMRATDFVTTSTYDELNLRTVQTTATTVDLRNPCRQLPIDSRSSTFAYDALGLLHKTVDFGGLATASVYDRAGRVLKRLEDPPGSGTGALDAAEVSAMTYDAGGRVLTAKDRRQINGPSLGQTAYAYDSLGRQISVVDAAGTADEIEARTTLDVLGRAISISTGGMSTVYRYDLGGRVLEEDDGFTCTRTSYDYRDLAASVTEGLTSGADACSGSGLRTVTNEYDGLGRLTSSTITAGDGLGDIRSQSTYDSVGNTLSSASVTAGVTSGTHYVVNALDQVVRDEPTHDGQPDGASRTNYDGAGNATDRCHWPDGNDSACTSASSALVSSSLFDARNQRIELSDATTSTTTAYSPDHNYQIAAVYLPTDDPRTREHQTLYTYDERHRLTGIVHRLCTLADPSDPGSHACSSTVATGSDTYGYDFSDNRTHVSEYNGATSSDTQYCYDGHHRLVSSRAGASCTSSPDESYEYDASGNRTKAVVGGATTTFTYNADSQLTACSPTCGTLSYKSTGHTRRWNGWWFSYDTEGRLVKACRDSGCASSQTRVEFDYDAEGRRTAVRTAPANGTFESTGFKYQGGSIVEEWTDGALMRSYTVDEAGAIIKLTVPAGLADAGTYLVTWNGHGDALALYFIESTGTLKLANTYTYSSWGTPTTTTHNGFGDLKFRYLYVGKFGVQWDNFDGLGLHYMRARHYAPAIGRFIQPDPARAEASFYAYVSNNPVTVSDPEGTCPFCLLALVVIGVGFLALDTIDYMSQTPAGQRTLEGYVSHVAPGVVMSFIPGGRIVNSAWRAVGWIARSIRYGSYVARTTTAIYGAYGLIRYYRWFAWRWGPGIVLGRHPAYVNLARDLGYRALNLPSWFWYSIPKSLRWDVNKAFLNAAVRRGQPIILASPPWYATKGTWFADEIAYLRALGYRVVYRHGQWQMVR